MKCLKVMATALFFMTTSAFASAEKWYRVEVLVIESKDKSALTQEWPINPGKPSLANAISPNSDPAADFGLLNENELTLSKAKKRLQQNYRLIMHKGWRQTLSDKGVAQNVRLLGGQTYGADDYEVDGVMKLSSGRYMNVDADLLFYKPMKLISAANAELGVQEESNQGTAQFSEVLAKQWQEDPSARLQPFRLKESSRLKADEIHYIDHPLYGIIIVVTPEKSTT